ncbi:MAG: hypothetical protein ABEJ08_00540 [Halobacteriaceae archaeon]
MTVRGETFIIVQRLQSLNRAMCHHGEYTLREIALEQARDATAEDTDERDEAEAVEHEPAAAD